MELLSRTNKNRFLLLFLSVFLICSFSKSVSAVVLTVPDGVETINQTIQIPVTVDDPSQIAGAAFTVTYDTDDLQCISIQGDFFDYFETGNEIPGLGTMISGASSGAGSSSDTLLVLNLSVKDTASGDYTINIIQSSINNTDAGYSSDGEAVSMLVGVDVSKDPSDSLAYPALSTVVDPGTLSIDRDNDGLTDTQEGEYGTDKDNPDTDNDGLPDAWETLYGLDPLDDSGVNGKTGDLDNDGWTNYEEYLAGSEPDNPESVVPTPPVLVETLPHNGAGINDTHRVPRNSSFAVMITDNNGIDITDPLSVIFTVDDGINAAYTRHLGNDDVVRVVKLTGDDDTAVTSLWVVYHRSVETDFAFGSVVSIKVDAEDRYGAPMDQGSFSFAVESEEDYNNSLLNLPDITSMDPGDPELGGVYDRGIEVNTGQLAGCRILYSSNEFVVPTIGPAGEVPPLDLSGIQGVGIPVNLQPPTVFSEPVIIHIPCAGFTDVAELNLYFHNGIQWQLACDTAGNVQPGGEGWMVPGSRVDRNDLDPAVIEIQVYHFTGVQAGMPGSGGVVEEPPPCFIATAAYGSIFEPRVRILREFRDHFLITNVPGRVFVKYYYAWSPSVAGFIDDNEGLRIAVRTALLPVVGVSSLMLRLGKFWSLTVFTGLLFLILVLGMKIRSGKHRQPAGQVQ